mgnify:CR=1 FL=1
MALKRLNLRQLEIARTIKFPIVFDIFDSIGIEDAFFGVFIFEIGGDKLFNTPRMLFEIGLIPFEQMGDIDVMRVEVKMPFGLKGLFNILI